MPSFSDSDTAIQWHSGEREVQRMLKAPSQGYNPTSAGLPAQYGYRVAASPLLAVGTLDDEGQPWTTIWGGTRGFARPIAEDVLGVRTGVDLGDPVLRTLWGGDVRKDEIAKPEDGDEGRVFAGLSIDLSTRDRVKLAGRFVAGAATETSESGAGEVQLALAVKESLGNCPKYLNKRDVMARAPEPGPVERGLPLSGRALEVVRGADMFFLSSTNGETMDTNHRGGSKGFVRVERNDRGTVDLVYPEFSGNRLYQTLGNLQVNPKIGIAIPEFDTSDVLYATGTASILVGPDAASHLTRTKLAVKITLSSAVFVPNGLPFRALSPAVEYSPYNPPPRPLVSEGGDAVLGADAESLGTATLTAREVLTPSITRLTFKLSPTTLSWRAGQHVTLDFAPELDHGWSHMRESDPQSLNDDYLRTFTVSSPPSSDEFQLTVRRHGPATALLAKHNLRVPLEIPVRGFGGVEAFDMSAVREDGEQTRKVFVAGGVGITPLLAQAPGLLAANADLELIWGLRSEDLALAVDVLERIPDLAPRTTLLVSGRFDDAAEELAERVEKLGVRHVGRHRMGKADVVGGGGKTRTKYYLCASPVLLKSLRAWLGGEDVVWEDFSY